MRSGASLSHVSQYNENAVIHALRALGPTSQTDIAAHTGLSVPAVSSIVRNLRQEGYLTELRTESVGRGRPRVIVDIVASANYAIGLHIDPAIMSAALLDLRGQVVAANTSVSIDPNDPSGSLDEAATLIEGLVAGSGIDRERLLGACAAVPGPLDDATGSLIDTVWLPSWTGVNIGGALTHRLGTPVPVIKDTHAAVTGEVWVRGGDALDSTMVFVYLGIGTGIGLAMRGEAIRGAWGNAGEIGRMLVALGDDDKHGMDNDPFHLVQEAHERGILPATAPSRWELHQQEAQLRELCRIATDGDAGAAAILRAAGERLAEMVVMVVEVFDADTVVYGGPNWEHLQPFYEAPAVAALARPSARGPHPVQVLPTVMGTAVGAIGAACFVLDERFAPRLGRR
ncbi:ROK family transcriptional regulator [Tessaracoccus defluvii]|uniref:ROK family transcriptional regulator n=1 Tax=Tessaracoccus defluvii TaxID=1285901 RepID=A0A7H0H3I6_9ACTN|nr:ROK family transcriptional regulator [Tessaracoccus defluvii]QNP55102.1 ROK family transcriptional regulator [Tessaracoccus defluvii]